MPTPPIADTIRALVSRRIVLGTVVGLWMLFLSTIVVTAVVPDGSALHELARAIGFLFGYVPLVLLSIVVVEPVSGLTMYEFRELLGPDSAADFLLAFVLPLTLIYAAAGLALSVLVRGSRRLAGRTALVAP